MFFLLQRRWIRNENDISAKKKAEIESAWIPEKNEDCKRKKSISSKKVKRKKEIISLDHILCGLFLNNRRFAGRAAYCSMYCDEMTT